MRGGSRPASVPMPEAVLDAISVRGGAVCHSLPEIWQPAGWKSVSVDSFRSDHAKRGTTGWTIPKGGPVAMSPASPALGSAFGTLKRDGRAASCCAVGQEKQESCPKWQQRDGFRAGGHVAGVAIAARSIWLADDVYGTSPLPAPLLRLFLRQLNRLAPFSREGEPRRNKRHQRGG